jgi:hypothetical protein
MLIYRDVFGAKDEKDAEAKAAAIVKKLLNGKQKSLEQHPGSKDYVLVAEYDAPKEGTSDTVAEAPATPAAPALTPTRAETPKSPKKK